MLRLLDTWLPLSILLTNYIYWMLLPFRWGQLPSRGVPSGEEIFISLNIAGVLAVFAGCTLGGVAALSNRSWQVGRICFFWSFIGVLIGSISGNSLGYWLGIEPSFGRDSTGTQSSDLPALLFLENWICGIAVGFMWGCICAAIHVERRRRQRW